MSIHGIARDTFIIKLLEYINFFEQRGISKNQVIGMILQRPRFFTHDIIETIKPICEALDRRNNFDVDASNTMITNNPGMFCNASRYKDSTSTTPNTPPPGGEDR